MIYYMLVVQNLRKEFHKILFDGASWALQPNSLVQLVGENGAGKSTILRMINGILLPDKGDILFQGDPVLKVRKKVFHLNASAAMGFYPRLSARNNFYYFGSFYKKNKKMVESFIQGQELFEIDYWDLPIERLSSGMLQKIHIVRAFLTSPSLLLMDEPLNNLDEKSRKRFICALQSWIKKDPERICIIVQHGMNLSLQKYCILNQQIHAASD